MEAKLIKTEVNYLLENEEGVIIASTSLKKKGLALSIKNCQAIENGYDLDELADEVFEKRPKEIPYVDEYDFKQGVMVGFQKALEILSDKKFSEGDMLKAVEYGTQSVLQAMPGLTSAQSILDTYTQSLQQTEWDCIIEMEYNLINHASGLELTGHKLMDVAISQNYKPKLDADGNLILKRK